jgi:hypothetical protein
MFREVRSVANPYRSKGFASRRPLLAMRSAVFVLAASAVAVLPNQRPEAQSSNVATFIVVQGKDTVSLEQFTRSGNTVSGVWISNQSGQVQVHDYTFTLGAEGLPARYEMAVRFPDGAGNLPPSEAKYSMNFGPDSLTLVTGRTRPVTQHLAMKGGAYPTFGFSLMGQELGLTRLRAAHADSGSIPFTTLGSGRASALELASARFVGPDSATVGTLHLKVDSAGHVLGWRTATGEEGRRVAQIDVRHFEDALLAADAAAEMAARAAHVITVPVTALDRLTGDYAINATTSITIARDDHKLTLRVGSQPPSELLAESATRFFLRSARSGQMVEFETDAAGNATALVLPQAGGAKQRLLRVAK